MRPSAGDQLFRETLLAQLRELMVLVRESGLTPEVVTLQRGLMQELHEAENIVKKSIEYGGADCALAGALRELEEEVVSLASFCRESRSNPLRRLSCSCSNGGDPHSGVLTRWLARWKHKLGEMEARKTLLDMPVLTLEAALALPIQVLVEVLETCSREPTIQAVGMLALQTFILQQGAGLVAEVGAAQTVQRAMVEHPFDLRVQRMSCKVMKLLAEEEENVVLLAGFGSVRLVIAALQRFGHDVEIQRCGSAAMHFLTVNRDSRIQCSSSGGPNTLHQTLSKYSSADKVIVTHCFGALANLAATSGDTCAEMLALGIPETVHKAMRHHTRVSELQTLGGKLLHLLACRDDVVQSLATLQEKSSDLMTTRECVWMLLKLTTDGAQCARIAHLDGVRILSSAMLRHPDDLEVQRHCCKLLRNLSFDKDTGEEIGDFDGIRLIHCAMWKHPQDAELQRGSCGALTNLALSKANIHRISDLNGVEVVFGAMERHREDVRIQRVGCGALALLATVEHNNHKIKYLHGDMLVREAIQTFPEDLELRKLAGNALRNFQKF